jgi:hypothetical protein
MAKDVVEDCKKVEIWWLKKYEYLNGFKYGGMEWKNGLNDNKSSIGFSVDTRDLYIRFQYTQTDYYTEEKSSMDYKFSLTTTKCNFGGIRHWFICGLYKSNHFCGRRVAVLYKPPGSKWFGCRHCWELSYSDRQQNRGGKLSPLSRVFDICLKAEKFEEKMKRWYWQGRPTRKHKRLIKYGNIVKYYSPMIKSIKP